MTRFWPEGGSGLSDREVYARRSLGGGLGYAGERLRAIRSRRLDLHELRPMEKPDAGSARFGENFVWTLLARKAP